MGILLTIIGIAFAIVGVVLLAGFGLLCIMGFMQNAWSNLLTTGDPKGEKESEK